jgi:hypothetical protein
MNVSALNPANLPWSAASDRNRVPILKILRQCLPPTGTLLEIGSGTGQHVVYFESELPGLQWQPTERSSELPGLKTRIDLEGGPGILPPLQLDVLTDPWPGGEYAAAFSANTAHIMGWDAVKCMFAGIGNCLAEAAPFLLYGPFKVDGQFTADSNRQFDAGLRQRSSEMGLRDIDALESLAARHYMVLERRLETPANNFTLVFRKESGA